MGTPWSLYDRLLDEIPSDCRVESCVIGATWTIVDAGGGMGLAMTHRSGMFGCPSRPPYAGRALVDVARDLKSWNLAEASVGMAAVNAHFNTPEAVESWVGEPVEALRSPGVFSSMLGEMAGHKVAVIGHFPGLEPVAAACDLTILERNPLNGDLPDSACEYVLPEQDFVFITGTTITNKTLPRLLELSAQARIVLVGPSVPLARWWFELGVEMLAGAVIVDKSLVRRHVEEAGHRGVFGAGAMMVDIRRADVGRASSPRVARDEAVGEELSLGQNTV